MTISFRTNDEVSEALSKGHAVVALESTLITHGLPWPENLETAKRAEAAVRAEGAVPCTIAIIDGQIRLGLDEQELETLARTQRARKVSRRDLAIAVAKGQTGATTVAATMIIAAQAGIEVFATGGIGGVHRGVEHTMDVSADLTELGQTPVTVVCAGAKIILDLPRTLERLETLGVPVLGYQTQAFPGFFCAQTGLEVDERLDDVTDVAKVFDQAHLADAPARLIVEIQFVAPQYMAMRKKTHAWYRIARADNAYALVTDYMGELPKSIEAAGLGTCSEALLQPLAE